ncbi:MAG: inositol monophosphatase [Planctomycetes bacterium]|jgi:myo-inositol-1(or 4)-monophosphatase|nr:inositol monophosphatase [Planctomycetota bacterium]
MVRTQQKQLDATVKVVKATVDAVASQVQAAVAGIAATIQRAQSRLRPGDVKRKGLGDFVTTVDVRSEAKLRRALHRCLPSAGFLGEESTPADLDRDWLWVVDPIDGTSNFSRGLPHFAVSVALLHQGDPVLGVVHCAPESALYVAKRDRGVRRNGKAFTIPKGRLDDGAILGCQWFRGQQDLAFLSRLQRRGGRIRTLGSSVTQLVDTAMGRLDANVQEQGRIWDIAAAGLVVEAAGGRFTDWSGRRVFPFRDLTVEHTPTIAASPSVHPGVLRLLAGKAGKDGK